MSSIAVEVDKPSDGGQRHKRLSQWVEDVAALTKPDRIYWCTGSSDEYQSMLRLMIPVPVPPSRSIRRSVRTASSSVPIPPTSRASKTGFYCANTKNTAGPTIIGGTPIR